MATLIIFNKVANKLLQNQFRKSATQGTLCSNGVCEDDEHTKGC